MANTYIYVTKDEDGNYVAGNILSRLTNVKGPVSGMTYNDITMVDVATLLYEGIWIKKTATVNFTGEFCEYSYSDTTFDDVNAIVTFSDYYTIMDLDYIRGVLRDRAKERISYTIDSTEVNSTIEVNGYTIPTSTTLIAAISLYASIVANGGTLPSDLTIADTTGVAITLDASTLLSIQMALTTFVNALYVRYATVCANINAATTYEDIRAAAVWGEEVL